MHFLTIGGAFDFFDTLAVVMLGISVLTMLASVRIAKWTHRLAESNRFRRQMMQARRAQLREHHALFYRNMDARKHHQSPHAQ